MPDLLPADRAVVLRLTCIRPSLPLQSQRLKQLATYIFLNDEAGRQQRSGYAEYFGRSHNYWILFHWIFQQQKLPLLLALICLDVLINWSFATFYKKLNETCKWGLLGPTVLAVICKTCAEITETVQLCHAGHTVLAEVYMRVKSTDSGLLAPWQLIHNLCEPRARAHACKHTNTGTRSCSIDTWPLQEAEWKSTDQKLLSLKEHPPHLPLLFPSIPHLSVYT